MRIRKVKTGLNRGRVFAAKLGPLLITLKGSRALDAFPAYKGNNLRDSPSQQSQDNSAGVDDAPAQRGGAR
jgi:hypothetical protein